MTNDKVKLRLKAVGILGLVILLLPFLSLPRQTEFIALICLGFLIVLLAFVFKKDKKIENKEERQVETEEQATEENKEDLNESF